ncbi:hypothetical protein [Alicyclobacillus herbarius]|uniref:hypothetical protein n=1 Tax=Alicyclobacillus herbarius TaxID=122960 RepID=UPI00041C61FA|nr:hypothetical protein [Alicyclobacillus herbarius]
MKKWLSIVLGGVVCFLFGGITAFANPQPNGDLEWPEWLATHSPQPAGDLEWPECLNTPSSPQ